MKRTKIDSIPFELSENAQKFTNGARIFDSSCSIEARVYYLEGEGEYYLKSAKAGTLQREAVLTDYFHKKGLGAEVMLYESAETDILITSRVTGEDCTFYEYLSEPKRLAATIGEELRALHELSTSDCPVKNRTEEYIATALRNYASGNYDSSHFPDSFGYRSADEAYRVLSEGKDELKCDILIHGDYCLPNIMLDGWRLSGFIDLGNAGAADRHIDLFWGAWTLGFNLGTDKYRDRFLDAYGRDKINPDILKVVAAAEVFG